MNGEFPGAPPPEEDFSKMSIEDRLASKAWKARVSAYEELVKAFARTSSESDPIFRTYTRNPELLRAMVTDSNAVAQEKGVDAARAFVEFGANPAGKTREVVVPSIVEKCLGSARAGTKKNALELIMLYAEMEDVMGSEGLVTDLLAGLKAKQPKVVAGCVIALKDLMRDFGQKQVKPNLILKRLPDIFAHSDKTVRAEGALLAQELHRYIGAALEPTLVSLKEIQAKELRQQFDEIDAQGAGRPAPTRFLLSQKQVVQAAPEASASAGADADDGRDAANGAEEPEEEIDPYDLADPVDVFGSKSYPADFEEMIASKKWQERKETLDAVLKVLTSSLKIKPDSRFDGLVDHLAIKIAKDANINVVLVSCQCLEAMAKGLRDAFARYKERVLPPIIEKLKEKKPATVEVLAKTLDAIFQTVTFSDVLEHILAATKHKNPSVKTESIRFLVRCLRTTRTPPAKGDIKPIGDALVAAMGDGSPDVRDAGAAGLGTLMKLIGERPMNQFLEGLDDIKKAKIQEEYKVAGVKVKMGGGAAAGGPRKPAPAAAPTRAAAPAPVAKPRAAPAPVGKENAPPSAPAARPPPRMMAARKPAAPAAAASAAVGRKPVASAAGRAAGGGGKGAASATEPVKYRFNPEDAEAKAAALIPQGIATQLASGVWKERLAGMTEFNDWLKVEVEEVEAEIIVRALGKKPGWKESNFQVLAEVYKALRQLAEGSPSFGRPSVALSVQPLCDKLGDIKLKGPAGETLILYAEKTSFGFLLAQALGPLAALKAPKAIADSILWVDQVLLEFGTSGVDVRGLIDYLVNCLKSANAAVRTNATKAIGTLARFLGTALNNLIGDINPQLRTTIEGEIEKAASNPPPAPVRFSDETRAPPAAAGAGAANGNGNGPASNDVDEDLLDELVPRVDLEKLIPAAAIPRMGDTNWKERKEALEEIQSIVTANTRLKGNMGDLAGALKQRYSDSNIMCKTLALDIISKIATAMNKGFEPHTKVFAAPIAQVMADAKAPVRASAAAALTAIAEQVGVAPLVPGFATVLESKAANPMLRQDLFTWLAAWFEAHPPEKGMDLLGLALPAVQCLDDKLAAVRKAAQAALPYIIMRAGYKAVMEQTNQLKTASRNSVIPLIDAAKAQAATLQPGAATAPAAAASAPRAGAPAATRQPARATSGSLGSPAVASAKAASAIPGARSGSPAPSSPRVSTIARPSASIKPPTAVGRSLKAPTSSIPSRQPRVASDDSESSVPRSRISSIKKVGSSSNPSSSSSDDKCPPFLSYELKPKAMREKREARGQNWIGPEGAARPELVDVLRQQCEVVCSRGLLDSMFSKGHSAEREFMTALTLISDFISNPTFAEEEYGFSHEDTVSRVVANSDLIFKYVAIRLTDNNTSLSLKCLDILDSLVELLSAQQYHLSDYEANSLLPCLIAKFGDPKVAFRDRIREIFRKMLFILPPSKMLTHYIDSGLPSKNARVRTECLSEVGYLFSKNGLQVCSPAKTLPLIAKQIGDRDANVRTAALLALGEAYKIVGDDVYRLIGSLPGKEMSLLEERLKRTSMPGPKPAPASSVAGSRISRPGEATAAAPGSPPSYPSGSRLQRPGSMIGSGLPAPRSRLPGAAAVVADGVSRCESVATIARGGQRQSLAGSRVPSSGTGIASPPGSPARQAQLHLRQASTSSRMAESVTEADLEEDDEDDEDDTGGDGEEEDFDIEQAINAILSEDAERSVGALKEVGVLLAEVEPGMVQHADQLAIVLGKQIKYGFAKTHEASMRLRKHLLLTASAIFDKERTWEDGRTLGSYISKSALIPLLTVLLENLIDATAAAGGEQTQSQSQEVAKYLNIVVLRCFSACDLNTLYGACLSMLTDSTEDMPELAGEVLDTRVKFAELIMKCLWKIAKRLPTSLAEGQVDPPQLLADVEAFLAAIPPKEWRRRAGEGVPLADMPVRTMKAILQHVVSVFADESLQMLDLVPAPEASFVYNYLLRMLDRDPPPQEETSAAPTPAPAPAPAPEPTPAPAAAAAAAASLDDGADAELRAIFKRISDKENSRLAIRELYEFQKKYPHKEPAIDRALQNTGPIFQRYVKRALANHAADDLEAASVKPSPEPAQPSSAKSSPRNTASLRSSTTDERLAELRAKFAKKDDDASPAPAPAA